VNPSVETFPFLTRARSLLHAFLTMPFFNGITSSTALHPRPNTSERIFADDKQVVRPGSRTSRSRPLSRRATSCATATGRCGEQTCEVSTIDHADVLLAGRIYRLPRVPTLFVCGSAPPLA
jgi:hypothetical protein